MELELKGKSAIITGASRGIGRAVAIQLAKEGVQVMAIARNSQLLDELEKDITENGGIKPVILAQDIIKPDTARKVAELAISQLGKVDILINNAGRSQPLKPIDSEERWAESMALEFDFPRRLTQLLLPHFIQRKTGAILNVISSYDLRTINASAVAKAALTAWSKQLASEVGRYGIRINCLQPGLIDTENIRRFFSPEDRQQFARSEIPLGDFGGPQDMASMATFLVSPRAKYITGSIMVVDGGMRRYAF